MLAAYANCLSTAKIQNRRSPQPGYEEVITRDGGVGAVRIHYNGHDSENGYLLCVAEATPRSLLSIVA